MRRTGLLSILFAAVAALVVPNAPAVDADAGRSAASVPSLKVTRQIQGLAFPWDVQNLPGQRLLVSERESARLLVWRAGAVHALTFPSSSVWVSVETGLMSLAADPDFAKNRRVYTCQGGFLPGGGHDVRVVAWRMNKSYTGVTLIKKLIGGFPTSTGRHGGCRLLITRAGALLVGTGDAAVGTNPQNLRSLGGKTLRLNRITGAPWPTNPWPHAKSKNRRYIQTYGHRNVQGLSQRADGSLWSIEQGTDRNDEVNKLVNGGNYGWNPVPGYDESTPMTSFALPGKQYAAKWNSGFPTLATSGGTWVRGKKWDALDGTLAVAALKASEVVFMKFDKSGKLLWTRTPAALKSFGRLRSITVAPDNDLLITTSNGDNDAVLRVTPE
ncbi:MAG: PQQ-dependent sugar dehydrogenase [Marmoricola sp.]|nr:PQQ-dependent sugar dehydrogenase [Marmoricola sp.]